MAVSRINEAGLNVDQYGNRNVVINGAMKVAQRSTSVTGIGAASGYFTADRFHLEPLSTAGRLTMTQESITDLPGFANCIKLDCTTADTSIAAGEGLLLQQRIEGQNLQRFEKGTSSAKGFTVSFYVKGNASATYVCELYDGDNTRQVSRSFSVTTSWNRVTINFPADTTGSFDDDASTSLFLQIWLHAGSTYSGGTLSTTWTSVTQANRAAGISSFFDSTARTFFITGVQLEVGDTATDFEHRTYADDLANCQRYYYKIPNNGVYTRFGVGDNLSATGQQSFVPLPVTMRTRPAQETTGTVGDYSLYHSSSIIQLTSLSLDTYSTKEGPIVFSATVAGGLLDGGASQLMAYNNTDAFLAFDAEL
tara:strand:- start:157 stop:1251 length:1095 start_codon:yes stop_codon:yes gene_type:complete